MGLLRPLWFKTAQVGIWGGNLFVSFAIDLTRVFKSEMQVRMFSVRRYLTSTPKQPDRQTDVGQRSAVWEENPLRVAVDVPASSVCCEVKPDVVTKVTSRWHMHGTAAQPVRCHIQTWQHLHLLRLSSHLTEYEVCVTVLQIVINKCVHHVLLSLFSVSFVFAPPPSHTHMSSL